MFCKNCGAENKDTARFCNDCGSLILRAAPSAKPPPRPPSDTAREPLVTRAPQPKAAAPLAAAAPQTAARSQAKSEPIARPQPAARPEPAATRQPAVAQLPRRQPRVLTASAPETAPSAKAATPGKMPRAETPQAQAAKPDLPKAAVPKVAVPKVESTKNEVPRPKVETPKPRVEMPRPMAEMPKAASKVEAPKAAVPPLQASPPPVKRTPRKMEIFEPSSPPPQPPPPQPPRAKPVPPERAQRLETFSPAMASSGDASITWPSVDTSPMRETGDQLFSGKARKPTSRADAEKFTILIALAVVVIAVIAVSAGGYYLYMLDPAPPTPPNLQKLSKAQREPPVQQQSVEEVSMVIPPLALSAPATERSNNLQADPNTEVSDAPPAAGIVEPETKAPPAAKKATKPPARVQPVQETPAEDPVITMAIAPVRAVENTKEDIQGKEDAKEDTNEEELSSGYKVAFKVGFGQLAETRTYPSKQMRNRALELWTLEQKILEPDGTVNDKYVLKEAEFSPIPGH